MTVVDLTRVQLKLDRKAVLNGDKNVKLSYGTINMNSYLFFSGYVRGARLTIGGHQFK